MFRLDKLHRKKELCWNNVDFSTREITSRKVRGSNVDFSTRELHRKEYLEATWIFWPWKLHQKESLETRKILRTSKLPRKKYVKTTWIFQNSWRFGIRPIDVVSTLNRRGFDCVWPLVGSVCILIICCSDVINFEIRFSVLIKSFCT